MKSVGRACWTGIFSAVIALTSLPAWAQTPFAEQSLVRQKCSACHKLDERGKIEVIEETRKSPEEWKHVVDRMIRLNSAAVEDKDFNAVVKELSWQLCLTPEEMAKIAYLNSDENSQYREVPQNDLEKRMYTACVRCHTWGKIASHRNTLGQWGEARVMHLGLYPTAVMQMREMDWPKEFQELVPELAKLFPFETPEWRQWMADRKDPDLGGKWRVAGYQPGIGYYQGTCAFQAAPELGQDEYRIDREIRYASGTTVKQSGQGTLYAGYHLRYALTPAAGDRKVEGVFDLDPTAMAFSGKWWEVVQDTNVFGNEEMDKADGVLRIVAVFPQSIRKGAKEPQELRVIGVNLPQSLGPADVRFSDPQVTAAGVSLADSGELVVRVSTGEQAAVGPVKIEVKGATYHNPLTVYDRIQGVRVFPALGRARVACGPAYPPQGVQFVARAVNYGPDGKEGTADDLMLEPVNAKWWLEEENTSVSTLMKGLRLVGIYPKFGREVDDDLKYVNAPVENGLYTPVTTYGPIPERVQHTEGTGLIAIGASCTIDGQEYKGRSLLAVTVTDFIPQIK
jgi:quinohemoprotein amine dehydrogenase